jgi:hypothetical protein
LRLHLRQAACDAATGTASTFTPAEPALVKEVENVKAMLSALGRAAREEQPAARALVVRVIVRSSDLN